MVPVLNFLRLALLLLSLIPLFLFSKKRAIFYFFKFSGPSFVKLGQILSTRPDLIGEDLSKTLSHFQDRLSPFAAKKLKKILYQEFGESFGKIFSEFDFSPIASASIAQVHKANLFEDKKLVAVKILRPRIAKIMTRDVATIRFTARLVQFFSSFSAKIFFDIADLLSQSARSELDLLREAANASRLKENLRNVSGFYVPEVFWKFSSKNILVLEWIDGIAFSNQKEIKISAFDKKKIAQNLVISYFNQVYVDGFFHADMHPGNLFLLPDGKIAVVDFGIMGKIDKKTRLAVAEILLSFLNKDYQKVAQIHLDAGLVPQNSDIDDLALSCREIGESIVDSSVKNISLAKLLQSLIALTRDYQMVTRPDLLLLQKTLLLVEGVGVMLDPDLNIWNLARPWVKDWAKRNISFDAKMRDFFEDLFELTRKFLRGHKCN